MYEEVVYFLGRCLRPFIFTIHKDVKYVLSNKSWNVMASSCIDQLGRWLGFGGKCVVGHDVDGLNTATLERMNQFRSRTGMIKAWLSLCFFSCQAACCLAFARQRDTRFLPLRWRHLVYPCLYSCASCAGGFVLWHRRTGYLEWTHGTDSCLQKRFLFVGSQEGRGSRECCGVDRSIGLGDEYGGLLWSWGGWG